MSRPLAILLGLLLGVVVGLTVFVWRVDRLPALTEIEYDRARQRWKAHGPASYEMDLELSGNRPGKIHVEVGSGDVTRMTRDGIQPKQRRTWEYWTVPGMFDTIEQELEKVADPVAGFHAPPGSQVVLRGRFDAEYGYPREYRRIVLGAELEVHWIVTHFEPVR